MTDKKSEKERAEKAREKNVKATLESKFIQGAVGSNLVKNNPSDWGKYGLMIMKNNCQNQYQN